MTNVRVGKWINNSRPYSRSMGPSSMLILPLIQVNMRELARLMWCAQASSCGSHTVSCCLEMLEFWPCFFRNTTIGIFDRSYWNNKLELNDQQLATFVRMTALALDNSITTATNGQSNPLLAQSHLISTTGSLKLPDTQWHTEARSWFETVLARYVLNVIWVTQSETYADW